MPSVAEILNHAAQAHAGGNFAQARSLYQQILALSPPPPLLAQTICRIGVIDLQQGRPGLALDAFQKAIALCPQEICFRFALGQALADLRRFDEAIAAYRAVLQASPRFAEVHFALGRAHESLAHWQLAAESYQSTLALQPGFPEAHANLGNCLLQLNQLAAAEAAYRQAICLRPDFAGAHSNLGQLLARRGRYIEALAELRQAVSLEPASPAHHINLGALFCQGREFPQAASTLREALRLDPHNANAHYNLGLALLNLGENSASALHLRHAIALDPRNLDAHISLTHACMSIGLLADARQASLAALAIDPQSVPALASAACVLRTTGDLDAALQLLTRAQSLDPHSSTVANNLGDASREAGDIDAAIHFFRQAIDLDSANALAHSNLAYGLHFQSETGQPILDECLRWNARHAATLPSLPPTALQTDGPAHDRPLRVGFLSGDFRNHCQSFFTLPLFSALDRRAFQIFCYSNVPRADDFTSRIQSLATHWRDIRPLPDDLACQQIRSDRLDLLVDLALHMACGRPGIFARRAAPVQVAWLGYPGTTGLAAMDFLLADPHLIPPHLEHLYRERIHRLPDSFWCYDPLSDIPVSGLPALSSGHVTFGSLNAPCKITDHTLALWSAILQRVPQSQLLLMAPEGSARARLQSRFAAFHIDPARLSFLCFQLRPRYLETYHQIDLALDPFPCNGHTTSLDACWMGVPVPSRFGETAISRGGLSQLTTLGFPEWACPTDEAYIQTVTTLASDLPRLAQLRGELRPRLQKSPLMDKPRFARAMESALRAMCTLARA